MTALWKHDFAQSKLRISGKANFYHDQSRQTKPSQPKTSKAAKPKSGKKREQKPVIRQSHLYEMVVIKKPKADG
jgi:hypothetical protein